VWVGAITIEIRRAPLFMGAVVGAGRRPYTVPIGGSNALGTLGYVRCALELAEQMRATGRNFAAVVVASGSAGTHAGLALAFAHVMPAVRVIGVTVSRTDAAQRPRVQALIERTAALLGVDVPATLRIELWDEFFAPRYGEPNEQCLRAISLVAQREGLLLDPVYTAKAFAGLLDGVARQRFGSGNDAVCFLHTGGSPALFAYASDVQPQCS
jgi:D-cysteine desulfhydrase